ncbi:MAG: porin family protein [Reichenbachiella sp.]|uniref:porin family protein n=1 Tax=Reichenbachiella sp. TaxID=2184521 RepID=UPI003266F3E4
MKKILLFIFPCMLLISVSANAQVEFGMMGGLNFNSPKIDAIGTSGALSDVGSSSMGFHVGLYATIDFELFAIQPEIYYSMQGGTFKVNTTQENEVNMDFIQIPLLGRYNFLEYFHVLAGPQFGIPVKSEVSLSGGTPIDIKDFTKGLEVSAVLGVGINVPEVGISGSLRWARGLTNMIDIDEASAGPGSVTSLKNSMIQISAAYAFGGGN